MGKITIKSSNQTRFGNLDRGFEEIVADSLRFAPGMADPQRIRNVYLASYAASELADVRDPLRVMSHAIQREWPALRARYHGVFKTGAEALYRALHDLSQAGGNDPGDLLVVGAEKMTHLDPATAGGILARRESPQQRAYGATLPALGGLVTRAYLRRHGVPEGALHQVAVKNHSNASNNPRAHFQNAVTFEEVATSPLVADPLRRLHCAPMSDGASAVVLGLATGGVRMSAWARGRDVSLFQDRRDISRFVATEHASRAAFTQAGVKPPDLDVVEIHDAFTSFELINLEEMGFYPPGGAWRGLQDGELGIDGRFAINPSGGMKARGHPIGAAGLSSVVEIHRQLTGTAGARQRAGAQRAAIQSIGGVSDESFVFVLDAR